MRRHSLALAALLSATPVAWAGDEPATRPADIELQVATDPAKVDAAERARRLLSTSRVVIADKVDLTGHIERIDGDHLVVVGRPVTLEVATVTGGGRHELAPGLLVHVKGSGLADGRVLADRVEVEARRDPAQWSKLTPELVKFREKFWEKAKRYEDPELEAYIRAVAERLLPPYVPESERKLDIVLVKNPDPNAFALPDGNIVLFTGIVARMDNEAQLASVLAHELAHYTQRHTLRAMSKSTEHKLVGWGSLLAALALGVAGEGDAAQGVRMMSSAWLSGYSRGHEDEADRVGLRYLYLAGYDVREAPKVWRTFQMLFGPGSREATFFYGSHSTPQDREHNLSQEVWKAYQPAGLIGGDVGTARFLKATAGMIRDNALLDIERKNYPWAEWGLMRSLAIAPDDAETHLALARLTLARGGRDSLDTALDQLQHARTLDPDHAETHRELGRLYLRLGRKEQSRAALRRYLELAPEAEDAEEIRRLLNT